MNPFSHNSTPDAIEAFRLQLKQKNGSYILNDEENNSDEYVNFLFLGNFEGKEVIYDAVIYTLHLHHQSEIYEIAEHKAAKKFPQYKKIKYQEDENGDLQALDPLEEEIGLYMAEVMMELEEEEEIKVREHVEIDPNLDHAIGLDAGLNVEKVTPTIIEKFISDYNDDMLNLDKTLYTFHTEDELVNR